MASVVSNSPGSALERLLTGPALRKGSARDLRPADVSELIRVVEGDVAASTIPRHRALSALPHVLSSADSVPLLARVAIDAAAGSTDRICALRSLGRVATSDAQAVLTGQLSDPSARVRQVVYAELAKAGGSDALTALASASETDGAAQRQLHFAQTVIAHRLGIDETAYPQPAEGPRRPSTHDQLSSVELSPLMGPDAVSDLAEISGSQYGIELDADVIRLSCGTADWSVFGNAEAGGLNPTFDQLIERPQVLALLARRPPAPLSTVEVQYLVLSRPSEGSVALSVVRTDGEIAYVGSIDADSRFRIVDVDREQTVPTELSGVIDENGVHLDNALVLATRVGRRSTEPSTAAE